MIMPHVPIQRDHFTVLAMLVTVELTHFVQVNIYLDKYDNDNKFVKKRRFEVMLTSFSSSNDYRPLLNYK